MTISTKYILLGSNPTPQPLSRLFSSRPHNLEPFSYYNRFHSLEAWDTFLLLLESKLVNKVKIDLNPEDLYLAKSPNISQVWID